MAAAPSEKKKNLARRASAQPGHAPEPVPGPAAGALIALVLALPLAALLAGELVATSLTWAHLLAWLALALAAALALLLMLALSRIRAQRMRLVQLADALALSARIDPLTGLPNISTLSEQLVRVAAHARRRVEPMSVLLVDLSGVGEINERFGHSAGDELLCGFAACMRGTLRADDAYGRLGGDQFLVLLPGTIRVQAELVAERLRKVAARMSLERVELARGIEMSAGFATAIQATPDALMHAARADLHRVKSLRSEQRGAAA